jgi:hypothetical protein
MPNLGAILKLQPTGHLAKLFTLVVYNLVHPSIRQAELLSNSGDTVSRVVQIVDDLVAMGSALRK